MKQPDMEASIGGDDLDPEIRRFVTEMSVAWSQHPALHTLSPAEGRRVAEAVRAPWVRGGPVMQHTQELVVPADDGGVRIRILSPHRGGQHPALVYVHGGGWTMFSIDTHDRLMREYAHRARANVIAVDYSLSPESKFPRALHEVASVVRWARQQGTQYGIDRDAIAVGGDSAGANLACATALLLRDHGDEHAVRGLLLNYGAYDSSCHYPSYDRYGGAGYMLGDDEMRTFWRNYLPLNSRDPLACLLHANLSGLPPAFMAVADCDVLHDENIAMLNRLVQFNVAVQARVYPGTTHSFLEAVSIAAVADRAIQEGARWLRQVLGP